MRSIGLEHFARLLKQRLDQPDCHIVWFVGAGCSISSGIPGAGALVEQWLPRLREVEDGVTGTDWADWASAQFTGFDPANPALIYGQVLERLFPLAADRQREVERLTGQKDPSIGYALLAVLLAHDTYGPRANTVLTTNFDDLVSDALYLMTRTKPLVVAHDSLAQFARASRQRPLIVKVHGDARLAPRNTATETAELDPDLAAQVSTLLNGCALILLGYGGNDQSIRKLLASLPMDAFPFGIYWIGRSGPAGTVGEWLSERPAERNDVFHVTHQDFDDLFLQLRETLDLKMPDSAARVQKIFDGYDQRLRQQESAATTSPEERVRAARARQAIDANRLVEQALDKSKPLDERDRLFRQAAELEESAYVLGCYAVFLHEVGEDYPAAEAMYQRAIAADPEESVTLTSFATFLYRAASDRARAETFFEKALAISPESAYTLGSYATFVSRELGQYDRAEAMYERAISIAPEHVGNLANFGAFLAQFRGDTDRAKAMFSRALAIDPSNAVSLCRLLPLKWARATELENLELLIEGRQLLARADLVDRLRLEVSLYLYAHDASAWSEVGHEMARIVTEGERLRRWNFSTDVDWADRHDHPQLDFVRALAAVITDSQPLESLVQFPEWQQAVAEIKP